MGRGNECLIAVSGSHDLDGATPIYMYKKSSSPELITTKLGM